MRRKYFRPNPIALAVSLAVAPGISLAPTVAMAQEAEAGTQTRQRFDIPAGPLPRALNRVASQAGLALTYEPSLALGKTTAGLRGEYSPAEALQRLLSGIGLQYRFSDANPVTLAEARTQDDDGPLRTGPITVEGDSPSRLGTADYERDEGFKADYQVSATKTPLPIRETPQSISVITRDSMEARQARDLGSALEFAAGVSVDGPVAGPFGGMSRFERDRFNIRGQSLDSSQDIKLDGFIADTDFIRIDPALYERVEVLKGPSSALYGATGVSGLINRVSKQPQRERRGRISASLGSFDTRRSELDVGGPLDEERRVASRLNLVLDDSGSFIDGADKRTVLIAPAARHR